jgi:hypothetical protein
MTDCRPKVGDVVIVLGTPGIFRVTTVDDDAHAVDVENTLIPQRLDYVPWNAIKPASTSKP